MFDPSALVKDLLATTGRAVVGGLAGGGLGLLLAVIWLFSPLPSPHWGLTLLGVVAMVGAPSILWTQAAALQGLGHFVVQRAREHRLVGGIIEAVITRLATPLAGATDGLRTLPLERLHTTLHTVLDEHLVALDRGRTRWLAVRLRALLMPRLEGVLLARWRAPEGGIDVGLLQTHAASALEGTVLGQVEAVAGSQVRMLRMVGLVLAVVPPVLLAIFAR